MARLDFGEEASGTGMARVFGVLLGGFVALGLLLAFLNWIGVPDRVIAVLLIALPVAGYLAIGFANRTMAPADYLVAGRAVPPVYSGMATAASWLSASPLLGLVGSLYLAGFDGLAVLLGVAAGLAIIAVLFVPYLRKTGAASVPEFLAARFNSPLLRLLATVALVVSVAGLLVAQLHAAALVCVQFLGLERTVAMSIACVVVTVPAMLGGMRGTTWTQVAQFTVTLIAFVLPIAWLAMLPSGAPSMIGQALGGTQAAGPDLAVPFAIEASSPAGFALTVLCVMLGTASMPHILMHSFATTTVRAARRSIAWAVLFAAMLLAMAPLYAVFMRSLVLEHAAGGAADFQVGADAVVLAMPAMAGMPFTITALVAAGALAAALAASTGLLVAVASTISHDLYARLIDRRAPTGRRLLVSRIVVLLVAVGAAYAALHAPTEPLVVAGWTFALSGSAFFAPLAMAVWWKRATSAGVLAGMAAGLAVCLYYLAGSRYDPVAFYELWGGLSSATAEQAVRFAELKTAASGDPTASAALIEHARTIANWWGVGPLTTGVFGIPVGFVMVFVVSLLTRAPSGDTMEFVEGMRIPRGRPLLDDRRV